MYVVYLPYGGESTLNLESSEGYYSIQWYNPRAGGELITTSNENVEGGAIISLGAPPEDVDKDWALLVKQIE